MLDTYQRYLTVYQLVQKETSKPESKQLRLLDVGSNGPGFANYNRFDNIAQTNIDIEETAVQVCERHPKVHFIQYAGDHLPFDDNFFDIAVCVDVLEHVPPELRKKFIQEVIRVSRQWTIFVFPVKSSERWERALSTFTFRKIKFLQEHIEYGLPEELDFYRVVKTLPGVKLLHEFGNINIWFWIPVKLTSSLIYRVIKNHDRLIYSGFHFYKNISARWINWGQCYSKTFVIEKKP